ncbi:unnamed protein product [Arabidopsis lyrata]|uniref:Predicted protein n=1 Tax=Arabidopsis lyrata subsp. lyrata TaxID=81972 RepID=D7LN85_ARALL|nr:cullin-like protein 5 [Arabidopsis lyrata subsp. lyrata]EFH52078.1 predicted protein [Arabidopsis lyrata subsp. lyrata]CAH8267716.1 unnamed protein product [Arabidopsis lyrata]|eukprot:XP_002875819.1 cullin-like protein 5 [Arabidopsis lyrata subsp. lyrata]
MSLPPKKHLMTDGDSSSSKKKGKYQDAGDPGGYLGFESALANPPHMSSLKIDGDLSSSKQKNDEDRSLSLPANISMKSTPGLRVFKPIIPDIPKPDPKIYLDDAWTKLKPAIRTIFLDEAQDFHCSEIFNAVRKAWWSKSSGETLYKLILEECEIYISAAIQSLESHCDDDPSVFLPRIENCCLEFRRKLQDLCSIAYEGHTVGLKSLSDLGIELFPKHLCLASKVRDKLLSINLDLIRDQRLGKAVDTTQLKNLWVLLHGPWFYKSRFFEKPFMDCAVEFYSAESLQFKEQSDIPQYLKHVEQMLRKEKENCRHFYFFSGFKKSLMEAVERILLRDHVSVILEKGFVKFMDERSHDDLSRMYRLFSKMDLLGQLNDALNSYILQTGQKMLKEDSSLAELKKSIDKICHTCFSEDALLEKTAKQCFKDLGLPREESETESLQIKRIRFDLLGRLHYV